MFLYYKKNLKKKFPSISITIYVYIAIIIYVCMYIVECKFHIYK